MEMLQKILMWTALPSAVVLASAGVAVLCSQRGLFPGRWLLCAFRKLPWPSQIFLLAFSLHLIVHGSIKTNAVGEVEGAAPQRGRDRNVASPLYEIPQPEAGRVPANSELAQNWWRRGCWDDWRTVTFGDGWVFPCGSNHLSCVAVMSQGEILASVCDVHPVASLGARVAHVPFDTCFYYEHTPSNSYRFVWNRAYIERNTNMPLTAAVELFRNGDTCVTTNGVSTVMPYEIPFPHVGIGQDDDWVRANFTNATDILAVGYADWVDAQVGVDLTNGLYKFTATFPDDPPEATELIVGDKSVCVTNAGEYVFVLEKGVEYDFGTNPYDAVVEYSMQDDVGPTAEIVSSAFSIFHSPFSILSSWWWGDDNGVWTVDGDWHELYLPWLTYLGSCHWEPKFRGAPDVTNLSTADFPMTFTALLTDCCHTNGVTYHWMTDDEKVYIASPYSQTTQVEIDSCFDAETFSLSVEAYAPDRTYYSTLISEISTNDVRGFSLSMPDTLFVNNDDDNDDGVLDEGQRFSPDDTRHRDDDVVYAKINLPEGPDRCGTLSIDDNDGFAGWIYDPMVKNDYVGRASEWEMTQQSLPALSLEVCGSVKSDAYLSSELRFMWTPENGAERSLRHWFTVVEPVVEPICSERKTVVRSGVEHKILYNPSGVVIGKNSYFKISVLPDDYPDSKIRWRAVGDGSLTFVGGNTGREVCVRGVTEGDAMLEIDIGGCSAAKPTFPVRIVENAYVGLSVCILSRDGKPLRKESEVREMLPQINDIFEQVGMSFRLDSLVVTNLPHACDAVFAGPSRRQNWSFDNVADILPDAGGLKCYFINSFVDSGETVAANDTNGMLLTVAADARTWAHEIGHACGLRDIYVSRSGKNVPYAESFEWRHATDDWNNGSVGERTRGSRYYRRNLTHVEVITKLLMYGYQTATALDISTGYVEGVVKIDETNSEVEDAKTGIFATSATRSPVHRRKGNGDE